MHAKIIENDKTDVYFIGDVHGEHPAISAWIKNCDIRDCIIIFCGDFGLGFSSIGNERKDLSKPNRVCKERNIDCYIVRGNHDQPSYFNTDEPFTCGRFTCVPDYTVIKTPNHSILCVGGAVSVDRVDRKTRYEYDVDTLIHRGYTLERAREKVRLYWWPDEGFIFDKEAVDEIKAFGAVVDTVATHTCPDFCFPTRKTVSWLRLDPDLEDDLINERNSVTELYNYLTEVGMKPSNWFYGHFHTGHTDFINDTRFRLLDMGRSSKGSDYPGGVFDMAELH